MTESKPPASLAVGALASSRKGTISEGPVERCRLFHDWSGWSTTYDLCDLQQTRYCKRCGLFRFKTIGSEHEFGPWEIYDFTKPFQKEGYEAYDLEVVVTHQRRRCVRCGLWADAFIRVGPVGPIRGEHEVSGRGEA